MQTNTHSATAETENDLMLADYLLNLLNQYNEEFRRYFYDKCREVVKYFANSPIEIEIRQWFFHPGNVSRFPPAAQSLFDNIKGLSKMTGLSFIKQFNLADKLKRSSRWVGDITSKLKSIALLFSRKTNKINYCLTFDLNKSVSDLFDTLVSLIFDHYSDHINNVINANSSSNNTVSDSSSKPSSESSSKSSSGSKTKFSLVNLLYTKLCDKSKHLEAILGSVKENKTKSKEGMAWDSQPASHSTTSSFYSGGEKEQPTVGLNLTENDLRDSSNKADTTVPTTPETSNSTPAGTEPIENQSSKSEPNKSIYTYELCEKYTIEYAKFKLGSNDEINDIGAFASYCYRSGEKDGWISSFIENNYVIIPYNHLKNNSIDITSSNQETQNKQLHHKLSNGQSFCQTKPVNVENQGKYSISVYLDYIERVETPRLNRLGKTVYSPKQLAKYMLATGDDDRKVGQFVELMKCSSVGARPSDFRFNNSVDASGINVAPEAPNEVTEEQKASLARLKQELDDAIKLESLRDECWDKLPVSQRESLLAEELKRLKTSDPLSSSYKRMLDNHLREHAIYQIKKRLVENTSGW